MAAKVLLVEDDNNLREIYEARLMAEGYTIVTAKDGEEALVVAKAELPNLIISDVMMPRISGFEMLDILRNTDNLRNVKVIMLTALGQADDKTRANSLGADRYLVKSQVTLEDIVKAAHELLEGAAPAATAAAPTSSPAPAVTPDATTSEPAVSAAPAPTMAAPATPAPAVAPTPAPSLSVQPEPAPATTMPAAPTPTTATTPSQSVSPAFNPTLGAGAAQPVAPTMPVAPVTPTAPVPVAPAAATPEPGLDAAPSTSDEEASIKAQIDNFVRSTEPATETGPAAASTTQDDAVLADAMHDLAANAEEKAAEPTPAATPETAPVAPSTPVDPPTAPTSITDNVATTSRKVIQPLADSEPKVGIHELLAREEANGNAAPTMPAAPATTFAPTAGQPQMPPMPQPGPTAFGPVPAPAPQAPANPTTASDTDPSNIAL